MTTHANQASNSHETTNHGAPSDQDRILSKPHIRKHRKQRTQISKHWKHEETRELNPDQRIRGERRGARGAHMCGGTRRWWWRPGGASCRWGTSCTPQAAPSSPSPPAATTRRRTSLYSSSLPGRRRLARPAACRIAACSQPSRELRQPHWSVDNVETESARRIQYKRRRESVGEKGWIFISRASAEKGKGGGGEAFLLLNLRRRRWRRREGVVGS